MTLYLVLLIFLVNINCRVKESIMWQQYVIMLQQMYLCSPYDKTLYSSAYLSFYKNQGLNSFVLSLDKC